MKLLGMTLLISSGCLAGFTVKLRLCRRRAAIESFCAAFRSLSRLLRRDAPRLEAAVRQLPENDAGRFFRELTRGGVGRFLRSASAEEALKELELDAEERAIILESCALLGGFDAETQCRGLEQAADRLQQAGERLAGEGMRTARVRQSLLISGALVAALLLI